MVEGTRAVTTILGPWNEPYIRNIERDSNYFHIDITTISIDDLIAKKRKEHFIVELTAISNASLHH